MHERKNKAEPLYIVHATIVTEVSKAATAADACSLG